MKRVSLEKKRKNKDLKILLDVSKTVSSSLNVDKVNSLILKKACRALGADHASLFLLDEKTKRLMLIAARGFDKKEEMNNIALLGSWERINYQVTKKKAPLVVNDIKKDPIFKRKKLPFAKKRLPLDSFMSVPLEAKKKIIGILIVSNKKGHRGMFTKNDQHLLMALANHASIALLNARLYRELEELFMSTITSLANTIDAKDPYTHGHSKRVMRYSLAIAKRMNVSKNFMDRLKLSSLLHDIGKVGIKDAILGKADKLTQEEAAIMRKHPIIGVNIISSIVGSEKFVSGISDHHEWLNGKGYPRSLKGNKISLEGKIIAIADAFDALTTDRPYQKRYTPKEACLEICRSSGTQFDPKVTKAFLKSFSEENKTWRT